MPAARRPALIRAPCGNPRASIQEVITRFRVIHRRTRQSCVVKAILVPCRATESVGAIANRGASVGSHCRMARLKDPNQQPQQREPALRIDGGSETGGAHDEALVPTPCPHPPTADGFRVRIPRDQTSHCVRRAEAAFLTHCLDWCGCIISPKWRHAGKQ